MSLRLLGIPRRRATKQRGSAATSASIHAADGLTAEELRASRSWQTRQHRIELGVWLTLALVPLLALAVAAVLALSSRPQPVQTGDAVLDSFIEQLAASGELVPSSSAGMAASGYWPMPGQVGPTCLAVLEQRFAGDPRLSLLQYHFKREQDNTSEIYQSASGAMFVPSSSSASSPSAEYQSSVAGIAIDRSVRYLEDARAGGYAGATVLLCLLRNYEGGWYSASREQLGGSPPDRKTAPAKRMAYYMAVRKIQDAKYGAAERQLLSELKAAAPEEALPHYYAAQFAAERGDYDAALSELRAGNRAPRNSAMVGFPYDLLYQQARQGKLLGDKLTTGWLAEAGEVEALPNFMRTKEAVRMLLFAADQRHDLAGLDELHTFACRFGCAEGSTVIQALVGLVLDGMVDKEAAGCSPTPLDSEQFTALSELRRQRDSLKAQLKLAGQAGTPSLGSAQAPRQLAQLVLQNAVAQLTGGRSAAISGLEEACSNTLAEQQALAGPVQILWDYIERFDYSKIGWESSPTSR